MLASKTIAFDLIKIKPCSYLLRATTHLSFTLGFLSEAEGTGFLSLLQFLYIHTNKKCLCPKHSLICSL